MPTQFLLGIAAAWILCGVVTAVVMRRRGHDMFVWLAIGSVLGPLVVPLAVGSAHGDVAVDLESHNRSYPGKLDLLVGLDSSEEANAALESALELLGTRASTVTLAKVLDYDSHGSPAGAQLRQEAADYLEVAAKKIAHDDVRTEVLYGRPDRALTDFADSNDIELIVIGTRGKGASEALFGSVAQSIAGHSVTPVLVGGRRSSAPLPRMRPD